MSITRTDLGRLAFDETADPMALPLSLLEEITDGFSDRLEIGRGGFSVVYKGMLDNGVIIAVKRLSTNAYIHENVFQREVECLMRVKHKNIVRFLGYCTDTQGKMDLYDGKWVLAETQQKLLCFEYLPKGSLNRYIKDPSGGLEWRKRYKIIKGICEGLSYLHHKNIVHLDLKPANILLDDDMIPKINDFGLSRCFDEEQTQVIVTKMGGTIGYLAPEFTGGVITQKFDLYSLGVIIMEILTGKREYQDIENVLEGWSYYKSDISQWEQIQVCAEIGMECTDFNPAMRPPSSKHVVERLVETEYAQVISSCPSDLLLFHPFSLCFHFEPNKVSTCPLPLGNNTGKQVAFRLRNASEESFLKLPLYGVVPPRSSYTLIVTAQEHKEQPQKSNTDMILSSAIILGDECIDTFQLQPDYFFLKAKSTGNLVQEVTLKAIYTPPQEMIYSSKVIQGLSGPLDIHPLELCFPFEHNKSIPCLLYLKNNTDGHVAFSLNDKSQWALILPIYSLIPPRSTHSLLVMAQSRKTFPETGKVLTLQSTSLSNDDFTKLFTGDYEELWKSVKESENTIHEMKLQAVYTPKGETTSEQEIPHGMKIIYVLDNLGHLLSVDANTTEPWMAVRRSGQAKIATIMDYVTQEQMGTLEATTWGAASPPKFICQREWIMAPSANDDGHIQVYNYEMEKIDVLKAGHYAVTKLAVHPTKLNVLSVCWAIKEIKLWDYEDGWKLSRTFVSERLVNQVVFNPKDTNINAFAISCVDHRVEVWDLDSSGCSFTLTGHQDEVNSLEFFTREDQQQYLITGSNDKTAKIWDVQTMTCVHTLEGFMSPVKSVFGHPNLPVLITGTEDGIIHLWSSTDFRLKRTLNMGSCGEVLSLALACPVESGRVVIGQARAISIIEFGGEGEWEAEREEREEE